jgi:hypothetical protein
MAIRRQNDALQRPDEHGRMSMAEISMAALATSRGAGMAAGVPAAIGPRGAARSCKARPTIPCVRRARITLPRLRPQAGDETDREIARHLTKMLAEHIAPAELMVVRRPLARDPEWAERLERRYAVMGKHHPPRPTTVLVAAVRVDAKGPWWCRRQPPLPDPGC